MGKYDKDRFLKELAVRYCLTRGSVPFLEVLTPSISRLSDSKEVLTDLDVVGIVADSEGIQRHVFFDCKSSRRMSPINRAFWAAGVKEYVGFDQAYVILRTRPVTNHRLSALVCGVDLHNERSFLELGRRADESFPADNHYQSSISRWEAVHDAFSQNDWTGSLFGLIRNEVPLTTVPWRTFRNLIADLRRAQGYFDPARAQHIAVFLDVLAAATILWGSMAQDISRFYEASMDKASFEKVLRYYIWGGRDEFKIRGKIAMLAKQKTIDIPAWEMFVNYAGLSISTPKSLLSCSHVFKELAIRTVTASVPEFDKVLQEKFVFDTRLRQLLLGMNRYLVAAGNLPKDIGLRVDDLLLSEHETLEDGFFGQLE